MVFPKKKLCLKIIFLYNWDISLRKKKDNFEWIRYFGRLENYLAPTQYEINCKIEEPIRFQSPSFEKREVWENYSPWRGTHGFWNYFLLGLILVPPTFTTSLSLWVATLKNSRNTGNGRILESNSQSQKWKWHLRSSRSAQYNTPSALGQSLKG